MGIAKRAPSKRGTARLSPHLSRHRGGRLHRLPDPRPPGKAGRKAFSIDSGKRVTLRVKIARKLARKAARKGKAKVAASAIAKDDSGASRTYHDGSAEGQAP